MEGGRTQIKEITCALAAASRAVRGAGQRPIGGAGHGAPGSGRCRVWYEYVASAQNPADVLSRAAWQDARVRQNIQDGLWKRLPAIPVDWAHLTGSSLEDLWSDIEALGI